jgi:hypothetical protein
MRASTYLEKAENTSSHHSGDEKFCTGKINCCGLT